jgi:hypothetical protein
VAVDKGVKRIKYTTFFPGEIFDRLYRDNLKR